MHAAEKAVSCPKCGSPQGERCTYVNTKVDYIMDDEMNWHQTTTQLKGEQTKRVHKERVRAFRQAVVN